MRIILTLLIILTSIEAVAALEKEMSFRVGSACDGNGSICAPRIYAEGVIQLNTIDIFNSFFQKNKNELPETPIVSFDSIGGNLVGGMKLGKAIRQLNLDTQLVGQQHCASACSLAFLGGVRRTFEEEGVLGIHRFYSTQGNIGDDTTQVAIVLIANYIQSMDVDRKLLDIASLVPADDILWLSPEQLQALNIDNTNPKISEWRIDTLENGVPFVKTTISLYSNRLQADYIVLPSGNDLILKIIFTASPHIIEKFESFMSTSDNVYIYADDMNEPIFKSDINWQLSDNNTKAITSVKLPRSFITEIPEQGNLTTGFSGNKFALDLAYYFSFKASLFKNYLKTIAEGNR